MCFLPLLKVSLRSTWNLDAAHQELQLLSTGQCWHPVVTESYLLEALHLSSRMCRCSHKEQEPLMLFPLENLPKAREPRLMPCQFARYMDSQNTWGHCWQGSELANNKHTSYAALLKVTLIVDLGTLIQDLRPELCQSNHLTLHCLGHSWCTCTTRLRACQMRMHKKCIIKGEKLNCGTARMMVQGWGCWKEGTRMRVQGWVTWLLGLDKMELGKKYLEILWLLGHGKMIHNISSF